MTPFEFEELTTALESQPEIFPFHINDAAGRLYLELFESWDSIPEKTRAVMMCVAADLRRQYYRDLQTQLEAKQAAARMKWGHS